MHFWGRLVGFTGDVPYSFLTLETTASKVPGQDQTLNLKIRRNPDKTHFILLLYLCTVPLPSCILNMSHNKVHILGDTWKKKSLQCSCVIAQKHRCCLTGQEGGRWTVWWVWILCEWFAAGRPPGGEFRAKRLRRSSKTPKWENMSCRSGAHCPSGGLWLV